MAPPARKVSGHRNPSSGHQTTLSFNHRVTKASVPKQSAKETALSSVKKIEKVDKAESDKAAAKAKEEQKAALKKKEKEESKLEATEEDEEEEADEEQQDEEDEEGEYVAPSPQVPTKSDDEAKAGAISAAQIKHYWRGIEAQRTARRVHQESLDIGEKVLRYFDVSSQFGPCVGIDRKKRWLRAQRLGLEPPIEVLAVLIQEEAKGVEGVERASVDAIMNPKVLA